MAIVAAVLGAVALLLGWLGVSSASLVTEQMPYLASGAVVGLFALGIGTTLWLSADMRDEWRKLDELHQTLDRIDERLDRFDQRLDRFDDDPSANGRSRPLRAPRTESRAAK